MTCNSPVFTVRRRLLRLRALELFKFSGRSIAATVAAASTGAALTLLVLAGSPNPALEWMRVITPERSSALPPGVIFAFFIALTGLASLGVAVSRWLFRRLRISGAGASFVAVITLAFLVAFTAETAAQIIGAWGNLTAADAGGLVFEDSRLTAHGWSTIARRAVIAAAVAGVMALSFWLAAAGAHLGKNRR